MSQKTSEFEPSDRRLERQTAESIYENTGLLTVVREFDLSEAEVYEVSETVWNACYGYEPMVQAFFCKELAGFTTEELHEYLAEAERAGTLSFDSDHFAPDKTAPGRTTFGRAWRECFPERLKTFIQMSAERIFGVLDTVSVETTDVGTLTTQAVGGPTREWVEVRPRVYEEVGDDDHLVFRDHGVEGTHLSFGQIGSRTYERLAWWESLLVTQTVLVGGILAFVSMLAVWASGPVWRRVRGTAVPERRARLVRGLLGIVSLLWLSVVVIFLLALVNFDAEVATPSLLLRIGQVLPYLALAGTIGAVVAAGLAWRDGYWSRPSRLHYSLVAVSALVFAWQLYYLRIFSL